ncbi:MAG: adenine phosphoribosyltransferase [Planctomycetota bacterium]
MKKVGGPAGAGGVERLKALIRDVPDFPKKGILFKDITPLVGDPEALRRTVELLAEPYRKAGVTAVAAVESRGFIFGAPVALALGARFVPFRKPGKLPWRTERATYSLEYGTDAVEVHTDAFRKGERVLLVDDLLATGGTMAACAELVEKLGATVAGCSFVIELSFLKGRAKLSRHKVSALIDYPGE